MFNLYKLGNHFRSEKVQGWGKRKKAGIETLRTLQTGFCDAARGTKFSEGKYKLLRKNHPETCNKIHVEEGSSHITPMESRA